MLNASSTPMSIFLSPSTEVTRRWRSETFPKNFVKSLIAKNSANRSRSPDPIRRWKPIILRVTTPRRCVECSWTTNRSTQPGWKKNNIVNTDAYSSLSVFISLQRDRSSHFDTQHWCLPFEVFPPSSPCSSLQPLSWGLTSTRVTLLINVVPLDLMTKGRWRPASCVD